VLDSLEPMLELSAGDYNKLLYRYYLSFVGNSHYSPQILIDKFNSKNFEPINRDSEKKKT